MLLVPGHLDPALFLGFDRSYTPTGIDMVPPGDDRWADLESQEPGPYLYDRADAERVWLIGVANDELGFFVLPFDYARDGVIDFEETFSLGCNAWPDVKTQLVDLLE